MAEPELHPRRHVFRGHSAGVAAHIRRPEKQLLPVQGCSALPVTGGSHESNVEAKQHNKYVSHGPITTTAYGDYVSAADGVATTLGKAFDAVPTETRVTASVQDLAILGKVHVGLAAMGLNSRSADGTGQPSIQPDGCRLDGVRIGDSRLKITLAEDFYREYDTLEKLAQKYADGLEPEQAAMFLPAHSKATQVTGFPVANGTVRCTIVQKIEWDGPKDPDAEIHGHVVVVKDFGKVYFGEMFISAQSRRLTMVRFQLGSPDGGEIVAADGDVPGATFPPT